MSEVFDPMHHAREVAEIAKDAMGHSLAADRTTASLAQEILTEAKRLLPNNRIVQSISFAEGDIGWVSVRSAMQSVYQALSAENFSRAADTGGRRVRSTWS